MSLNEEKRPLVYIAGAITSHTAIGYFRNRQAMIEAGYQVIMMGASPYIPVAFDDVFLFDKNKQISYDIIWETNAAWMRVADVVLKISDSVGADKEEKLAILLGIPVVRTLAELNELLGLTAKSAGSSS